MGADPNHDVFGLARAKLLVKPRGLPDTRLLITYAHTQSQAPQIVGLTAPFRERHDTNGLYGTFRINVDALHRRRTSPPLARSRGRHHGDRGRQ